MKVNYTEEKNVLMLIKILKENNISKIIASPGTTNISFVTSVQHDPFFKVYSCVDERSACYMACGLASESGEPVVLTCTGATASRNYIPGLTEAYYRKIPILAVTCAQHFSRIGQLSPQALDRSEQLADIVNLSVQIPTISTTEDEFGCNVRLNKAISELKRRGGGPVHINITTSYMYSNLFGVKQLPNTRIIKRYDNSKDLPKIEKKKIGIFVGSHLKWSNKLVECVDKFCEIYNAVVITDHTGNYTGKYKILANLVFDQEEYNSPYNSFDLIVDIGEVSGSYLKINVNEVWRVSPDGEFKDRFFKLTNVFEMDELTFFKHYTSIEKYEKNISRYERIINEYNEFKKLSEKQKYPLSNIYVAMNIMKKIPKGSVLYLAILNSLRSWNYFSNDNDLNIYSNTGGFGIDGTLSTLIGASLAHSDKLYFGVVGDLAFFYDLNSLGNRNVGKNLRIILINNGCGTEFHNYSHPAYNLGELANDYIAADGHYGNKSNVLVKDYAENLGFEYISSGSTKEVIEKIDYFTDDKIHDKSIIFEIFTNKEDESKALKMIRNLKSEPKEKIKQKLKQVAPTKLKVVVKKVLGKM